MKHLVPKLVGVVLLILFITTIVLPVGIKVGQSEPVVGPTPTEHLFSDGTNTYQTEVVCKYLVRSEIKSIPYWRYSTEQKLDPPSCDIFTLYWHDGWLIDKD